MSGQRWLEAVQRDASGCEGVVARGIESYETVIDW